MASQRCTRIGPSEVKPSYPQFLILIPSHDKFKSQISYEPSFTKFELSDSRERAEQEPITVGRRTFGTFVPDIDVGFRAFSLMTGITQIGAGRTID